MVTTIQFKTYQKKVFNKFSRFILIGNNIDGSVNVDMIDFDDFEAVKLMLPNIIKNLKFEGEWDLILYQIHGDLKIKVHRGAYRSVAKGKIILHLSYMNVNKHREVTINDSLIHVYSYNDIAYDIYNDAEHINDGTIYEEYVTVLLFSEKTKKSNVMEELIEI